MLQLRHLNLHLALAGLRTLGEDVENERGAIEHLAIKYTLQIARLCGTKFVIKNDRINRPIPAVFCEFCGLSLADESGGMRTRQLLESIADYLCSRGVGQFGKFIERFAGVNGAASLQLGPNEKDSFSVAVIFREGFQVSKSMMRRAVSSGDSLAPASIRIAPCIFRNHVCCLRANCHVRDFTKATVPGKSRSPRRCPITCR